MKITITTPDQVFQAEIDDNEIITSEKLTEKSVFHSPNARFDADIEDYYITRLTDLMNTFRKITIEKHDN
jgi:hypothetical protein